MSDKPLCKYGCGTVVTKELPSCEMCCPEAVAEREARVAPIHEAEKKRNAERTAAQLERQAAREKAKKKAASV